jgi:hypothetical protein
MIERELNHMKTSTKSILPLLIVIISIFTGVAIANGKNVSNMTNEINVTIPNVTIYPNVTVDPNVTVASPTPVMTPDVTVTPNVTAIPTVTVVPIVTAPIQTPVIISNVTASIPALATTPNATVVPITTVQAPVVIQDIVERNTTVVYVPMSYRNATRRAHTSKQNQIDKQTAAPISTVGTSANSSQNSFFGDITYKIIIGAILGLVGLFYEIIKIKYDHKQKAKAEKINEDTQNKLLEKLEKRQKELFAKQRIYDKQQDVSLNDKPEMQQEDMNDKNI